MAQPQAALQASSERSLVHTERGFSSSMNPLRTCVFLSRWLAAAAWSAARWEWMRSRKPLAARLTAWEPSWSRREEAGGPGGLQVTHQHCVASLLRATAEVQ